MGSFGRLANRAPDIDVPVMVKLAELNKSAKDAMPLGQGAVYWQPPGQALEKVKQIAWEISSSRYGTHEGLPELREALVEKLCQENKLSKSSVMVTAGSNQGFLNLVLALCHVVDSVVLFAPYFFNAYMSFKMTGINNILVGPSDPMTLLPDADWLEKTLSETKPVPKLVSIVNPGNPSGTCIPEPLLKKQDVNGSEVKSKALPETKNSLVRPFHLFEVVCWFARRHGVLLLPGFACGTSGCIRITYGMLTESECNVAAKRHERGGRAHQRGHGGE
ncbi:unnamed protein product [Camellia sinensis]